VSQPYREASEFTSAHRAVKVIAWVLLALGLLEWFVLGANRPVDPVVSPVAGVIIPLVVRGLLR
jgi:hypothetical protein